MPSLFARAAGLVASLVGCCPLAAGSEPLPGCAAFSLAALAERLPEARRFSVDGAALPSFVALWPVDPGLAEAVRPDSATVFALPGRPLLVALTRAGCVVGAFTADQARLFHDLRARLGLPI